MVGQFFSTLKEDVMLNYPRDDVFVTTARVALFFTLLFSYPVLLHPTREAINRLFSIIKEIVIERMTRTRWNEDELDEQKPLNLDLDSSDLQKKTNGTKVRFYVLFPD